jgi:hypothetical protein
VKGYVMDTWKAWIVQAFGGTYLVASVWTFTDSVIKAMLGVAMLILVIFQIRSFARRERSIAKLESLICEAEAKCPFSVDCPLRSELKKQSGKQPEKP